MDLSIGSSDGLCYAFRMEIKRPFECLLCAASLGKREVEFVDENTFSFLAVPPASLSIGSYCPGCFDAHVRPEMDAYQRKLEQAKNVNVFFASQSKESRFVRRIEKPVTVKNCQDRDEAILRLAFLAVEANKNSLVDVDLSSTKIRNGSWQSSLWSGQAIPTDIDEGSLQRRFPGAPN